MLFYFCIVHETEKCQEQKSKQKLVIINSEYYSN